MTCNGEKDGFRVDEKLNGTSRHAFERTPGMRKRLESACHKSR